MVIENDPPGVTPGDDPPLEAPYTNPIIELPAVAPFNALDTDESFPCQVTATPTAYGVLIEVHCPGKRFRLMTAFALTGTWTEEFPRTSGDPTTQFQVRRPDSGVQYFRVELCPDL